MKAKINKVEVQIIHRNILELSVEGIVVVTDPNLSVSPELAVAAGESIISETANIGWCEVGSAVITTSGLLPEVRNVIHAVGPRWGEGSERGKLGKVTWECLTLAEENQLRSIAVPAISVGGLGYPVENCATVMLSRIIDFTFENLRHLRSVTICLENTASLNVFQKEFRQQIHELQVTGQGKVRA
jgi:O-acetyl-ADP-ribose deacetylase